MLNAMGEMDALSAVKKHGGKVKIIIIIFPA